MKKLYKKIKYSETMNRLIPVPEWGKVLTPNIPSKKFRDEKDAWIEGYFAGVGACRDFYDH